jgi:phosphoribosyl 1,2-cyclic phosphodiesterase
VARGLRRTLDAVRGWTLGSGSRGNGLVLESGGRYLLVDCGFGPRALASRLKLIGVDPQAIEGLVITHEHTDHASGAARAQHKWRWPVYASAGTLAALPEIAARWRRPVGTRATVETESFQLDAAAIPHDAAAPYAYAITARASGARVAVAHDLGRVPAAFESFIAKCDALCIEANHDVQMLRDGPYHESLKARIRGGRGHLNNAETGALLAAAHHAALRAVVLLHLRETNNTPELAERTVTGVLRRVGYRGAVRAAPGRLPGVAFEAFGRAGASPGQLALAL